MLIELSHHIMQELLISLKVKRMLERTSGLTRVHSLHKLMSLMAGHLRWKVDYPPPQPVGSGFEPHWRPQPAKLPSIGGYSLETLPYLTCTSL